MKAVALLRREHYICASGILLFQFNFRQLRVASLEFTTKTSPLANEVLDGCSIVVSMDQEDTFSSLCHTSIDT